MMKLFFGALYTTNPQHIVREYTTSTNGFWVHALSRTVGDFLDTLLRVGATIDVLGYRKDMVTIVITARPGTLHFNTETVMRDAAAPWKVHGPYYFQGRHRWYLSKVSIVAVPERFLKSSALRGIQRKALACIPEIVGE
jgi:hypothetical protein